MEKEIDQAFQFGKFLLTPRERRLTHKGNEIKLRPKTFEVLSYLARRAGHVVQREELFRAIWPRTHVSETVLDHSIWEIREALNDYSESVDWIETVPKVGYRFIGRVETISDNDRRRDLRAGMPLVVALCVSLMVLTLWHFDLLPLKTPSAQPEIDSIAVLPFVNVNGDEVSEYLCSGIPETISASLTRISGLKVTATSSLHRYRNEKVEARIAAAELNVRLILTGSVLLRDRTLKISAELVDGQDNRAIWSRSYRTENKDIFAVEEDVARRVAEALRPELADAEREDVAQSGTSDPEAYQAFLAGEYFTSRWVEEDSDRSWRTAISHYEKAIKEDPSYQKAFHGLGFCYFWLARQFTHSDEDFGRARNYWERLIEVDQSTWLAHAVKAFILWSYDREWEKAEREYKRAAVLVPEWEIWGFANFTDWMGHKKVRLAQIERLVERCDPLSASQQCYLGWAFLWNREYDRAIEQAEKTLELEHDSRQANTILAFSYAQKGMEAEAFEAGQKSRMVFGANQKELTARREAFEKSGMEGVWRWQLDRVLRKRSSRPVGVARFYAKLGFSDKALEWLEKTWSEPLHGFAHAPSSFDWDGLRKDPRFEQLLRKLNLPEEAIQRHLAVAEGTQ
jgi:DNA-binding winged helix-turn-helix (wHTH) protein/TolB-like protein/Tfp pilus assembly protein PilF